MWNGGYFGVIHFVRSIIPKILPSKRDKDKTTLNSNGVTGKLGEILSDTVGSKLFHDFVSGAIGGTVGTILNTPLDVVKTRIQGHIGPHPVYRWALPSLWTIWREEGFGALFRGFKPKVIRLGPGGGILLVVYDRMIKFFQNHINQSETNI